MDSNLIRVKKEAIESTSIDEQPNQKKMPTNAVDENGNKMKVELQPKIEENDEKKPTIPMNPTPQNGTKQCRCRIDLSSPASLERDFYAWLNGVEPISDSHNRQCLFSRPPSPPPPPAQFAPFHPQMMPSDRLQMLTLAECPAHLMGLQNIGHPTNFVVELPAFLVAPSDCSSSASSSFSSSASASSSSISPGGTAAHHCCQFASSAESGIIGDMVDQHQQHFKRQQMKQPATLPTISAFTASNEEGAKSLPPPPAMRMRRKRNVDKASGRGTNLYGRIYCPGRPLSMEERAQIIHLFHGGMKVNAISKQLCISHGCVSKIITRFRETGNLMPSSHSECRRRKRLLLQQQQQQNQMVKKEP